MARGINKLSALKVSKMTKSGLYGDGAGLWLQVSKTGSKSWLYRYTRHGKAREMGLGALHTVSLQEAREKARECRSLILEGYDPLEEKRKRLHNIKLEEANSMTFAECASAYIEAHRSGWKNAKHVQQWESTINSYVNPVMGILPVSQIDTTLVLQAIEPIWQSKTETATRVRGRIEMILDWAKVRHYREGENPARWRGHLDKILPAPSKVTKVTHHAAIPYRKLPEVMHRIAEKDTIAARALEFTILTAARTGEVIGARWDEIDLQHQVWVIPAKRMKMEREHRVPLCDATMTILNAMHEIRQNEYVFYGAKTGKPLSNMALIMVLRRMNIDCTTHGFRSTFRDWVSETTNYPHEVAEMALAHAVSNKVEAAYRRGDLFLKRKQLMQDWAVYCYKPTQADTKVVDSAVVAFLKPSH